MRFERSAETAQRLRSIIAAEEECFAFLTFELIGRGDELKLMIGSSGDGRLVTNEPAAAFA